MFARGDHGKLFVIQRKDYHDAIPIELPPDLPIDLPIALPAGLPGRSCRVCIDVRGKRGRTIHRA